MKEIMAKAMNSAREGITISDASLPHNPLIFVNEGFTKMTGYSAEEVMGKNCRFLQGELSDPKVVKKIREALQEKKTVQVEILNYRKNNEKFWNRLSITPVFNEHNAVTHFIGVQDDITIEKMKQEMEQKIARQNIILETTINAQEKERLEIGKELHDNVNQLLATASLYLGLSKDQEEMRLTMIDEAKKIINQSIEEIRKLSKSLVGPSLTKATLKDSLAELVQTQQLLTPFKVTIDDDELNESELSESKKLMIFRIVQEQLNNIRKHANAEKAEIHFSKTATGLLLSIKDNGVGFDPSLSPAGIGLQNIQNRVDAVNGSLDIQSAPAKGCELAVMIPL